MGKKFIILGTVVDMASRGVNANSSNVNFGPGAVNEGNVNSYNELFNSDGNENDDTVPVRPVASINCGCIERFYARDNIETDRYPVVI